MSLRTFMSYLFIKIILNLYMSEFKEYFIQAIKAQKDKIFVKLKFSLHVYNIAFKFEF